MTPEEQIKTLKQIVRRQRRSISHLNAELDAVRSDRQLFRQHFTERWKWWFKLVSEKSVPNMAYLIESDAQYLRQFKYWIMSISLLVVLSGCGSPSNTGMSPEEIAAAKRANKVVLLVSWNANTEPNILEYRLYRDTTCTLQPITGTPLATLTGTQYFDQQPTTSKTRQACYDVTAVNTSGMESAHSERYRVTW